MATLTVKNLTTASGQDLALRTGGTDRLTISSSDGSVTIGGGLALGPSPASSGYLRIPNSQYITARNAANTGNVNLIGLNSSDQVVFGTGLSLGDQSITNVYSISQTTSSNWNISNAGAATFAGNLNLTGAGAQLYVGNTNTSTQSCLIQIGNGRTGSGQSYIDFIGDTTYTDFGMRLARDGGANASSYIQHRGTGDLTLLGQDASAISLRTNNTERFRITSDGNIAVSTSTLRTHILGTSKFQIEDTTAGGSVIATTRVSTVADSPARVVMARVGGSSIGSTTIAPDQSTIGALDYRVWDGSQFLSSGSISSVLDGSITTGSAPSSLRFYTQSQERVRITSDGKVGISTGQPAVALQVNGDNDTTDGRIRSGTNTRFIELIRNASVDNWIRSGGNTDFIIDQNAAGNLIFRTSATERMRINSSGNVGIGTTSPSETLHIKNSAPRIRLEDTDGGNANIYATISANTAATGSIVIQADTGNSGTGSFVSFEVDAAERSRITSDGDLLIGTSTIPGTAGARTIMQKAAGTRWQVGPGTASSGNTFWILNAVDTGVALISGNTAWSANSDERLKKNIQDLNYGLAEIKNLRPVRFDYSNEESNESKRIGFIAQEVLPLVPESVSGSEDSFYSLASTELIPVLVAAIKELSAKVEELEARLPQN